MRSLGVVMMEGRGQVQQVEEEGEEVAPQWKLASEAISKIFLE